LTKEVKLLEKRVVSNPIINCPKNIDNRDSGAIGKYLETILIDNSHNDNKEDIKGLELKTKNISSSETLSLANYTNAINSFDRTFNKIKRRLGLILYKIKNNKIIIISFKIYETCKKDIFDRVIITSHRKSQMKFLVQMTKLDFMYKTVRVVI